MIRISHTDIKHGLYTGTTNYGIMGSAGSGDVVQLTDSAGNVVKTYEYDAFGNEKSPDPNDTNPFRYAGKYWDSETGTYYTPARNYNPVIGRWTQPDPYWNSSNSIYGSDAVKMAHGVLMPDMAAIMQSGNLYAYCMNNPIKYTDPTGELAFPGEIHDAVSKHIRATQAANGNVLQANKYVGY